MCSQSCVSSTLATCLLTSLTINHQIVNLGFTDNSLHPAGQGESPCAKAVQEVASGDKADHPNTSGLGRQLPEGSGGSSTKC